MQVCRISLAQARRRGKEKRVVAARTEPPRCAARCAPKCAAKPAGRGGLADRPRGLRARDPAVPGARPPPPTLTGLGEALRMLSP